MNKQQKSLYRWLILAGVIILAFLGVIFASQNKPTTDSSGLTENEWFKGNKDATVILMEYSDFQCPACKSREAILEPLIAEFSNHMKFVYRYYPLRNIHKNAQLSSQAAEAAGLQGKFWEMHGKLFETQSDWSELPNSEAKIKFTEYAETIGLDLTKFEADLESEAVVDAVNEDYALAMAAKITGTPTFFLNGQEINIYDYEQARQTIRQAIETAAK